MDNRFKNIVLVGMPGSGKSSLGKKLAAALQKNIIDLDREIEHSCNSSIDEIFLKKGEEYFRVMESSLLEMFLKQDASIIAVGGGAPCFHNNMDLINKRSVSIFIDLPLKMLASRIKQQKTERPLFKGLEGKELLDKIEAISENRRPYYLKANFKIHKPSLAELIELVNNHTR